MQQNTKVGQSNKQDATAMMVRQDSRHEYADLHGNPINRIGKCLVAVLINSNQYGWRKSVRQFH